MWLINLIKLFPLFLVGLVHSDSFDFIGLISICRVSKTKEDMALLNKVKLDLDKIDLMIDQDVSKTYKTNW